MKKATNIFLLFIIVGVVIAIVDLWFDVISPENFIKLGVTGGLIVLLFFLVSLISKNKQ